MELGVLVVTEPEECTLLACLHKHTTRLTHYQLPMILIFLRNDTLEST